jgi:hypothetical protein
MVILVSEASNRYAHLLLVEREYFGFNTLEGVIVKKNMTNIRIQKLFVIGNLFFFLTNKETAKAECVITSLNNFIFSGCHS